MPLFQPTTSTDADVAALAQCFREAPIEGIVTHAQMSQAVGYEIRMRRHLIKRARTIVRRETGAAFSSQNGIGYRRLASTDVPNIGRKARRHTRRVHRAAAQTIIDVMTGANDITPEVRARAFTEVSALNLLEYLARDRTVAALPVAAAAERPTPVAITLRSMAQHLGIEPATA